MTAEELEEYFKGIELPKTVKLSEAEVIIDVPKFIQSHLLHIREYNNNPTFSSYQSRLLKLKKILSNA